MPGGTVLQGPQSQKPRLVRLDSTTASHGITMIAHSHESELDNWWCVHNMAKPWLYSLAEQIIVWHSNGASRITVGAPHRRPL